MATKRLPRQRGLTLVELMVVVAIIAILAGIAVVSVRSERYGHTVLGFSKQISAEVDAARMRAVATGRWQQLEIQQAQVIHWEATTVGMGAPVEWEVVRRIGAPHNVLIAATDDKTHMKPADDLPTEGDGLPGHTDFAPDGSAQAADLTHPQALTVFLRDVADSDRRRVAIFRATGTSYVFKNW